MGKKVPEPGRNGAERTKSAPHSQNGPRGAGKSQAESSGAWDHAPSRGSEAAGLLRSSSRMRLRRGRIAAGETDSSSMPMRKKVSVSTGSAPSSPQTPTQQP